MKNKLLAWLLALCLLLIALSAFAEEAPVEAEAWEAGYAPAQGETGALGLIADENNAEALPEPVSAESPEEAPGTGLSLGVGETAMLTDSIGDAVSWTVSDETVATVSGDGIITALSTGDARIDVTDAEGVASSIFLTVLPAPDAVAFALDALTLGKGESVAAPEVLLTSASGATAGRVTLTSSSKKVLSVSADGTLKALKTGKATLTATAYNGIAATCAVRVVKAPTKLTLTAPRKVLGVGESLDLIAKLPKGTAGRITYTSDQPEVLQVDPDTGAVTAVSAGKAKVQGRTFNSKKASVTLEVRPAPEALSFDSGDILLGVGQEMKLSAALNDGAAGSVAYASTDESVCAVSAAGEAKGIAPGTAEIVATSYNGIEARMTVTVRPAPEAVSLPFPTLTLGVGEKYALSPDVGDSAASFTYSVKSSRIASVTADGVVKGVRVGTTTLTVKTYNGKRCTLKVTVKKAPSQITVSPKEQILGVGQTFHPSLKLSSGASASVTWSSSDEGILLVDSETGETTALAEGDAEVVARSYNGREGRCRITVKPASQAVEAAVGFVELGVGQTFGLDYALVPEGSAAEVRFVSDNPEVAAVSDDGTVTAKSRGTAAVGIQTHLPEVADWVTVTVWDAPEWVSLGMDAVTLNLGETMQLRPTIPEGSMSAFTFASSDPGLASIDADGNVVAMARGAVTLTASAYNGKKAELALTILDPWYPEALTLGDVPDCMRPGDSFQVLYDTVPADAIPLLSWTSTAPKVASVDTQGMITAVSDGMTTIVAVSEKNPALVLRFNILVQSEGRVPALPARVTDISGISANLAKIDTLRRIAVGQIDTLQSQGEITASEASKRRAIVNNAFRDYAFPWMTPSLQKYWKAANSEGGAKDFKPGIVYYGMPYMSGSGANRQYNAVKAIAERRYTDSGSGYYLLNKGNLLKGRYVGNDCSCFVNHAIWGANSSHAADRTSDIAKSGAYYTLSSASELRPGDLLCKSSAHVVMFLYFTNAAHTQIMIIENGGAEPAVNTVHCSVYNLSYYTKKGYLPRRLSSLR